MKAMMRAAQLVTGQQGIPLPKNLLSSCGRQYEAFENDLDWTLYNGGSKESNTTQVKEGNASEKVTSRVGAQSSIRKTVAWDLSAAERLGLWIYVHDPQAEYHSTDGLVIYLQTSATLVDYYKLKFRGAYMDQIGWHYFATPLARATAYGSPDWSSIIRIMFETWPVSGQVVSVSVDDLWMDLRGIPAVMLYFDDGYSTQYSVAFARMKPHRMRATLACRTDVVGTGGFVTVAQLREMHAAGWAIANHTNSNAQLAGQSEANQTAQIQGGYNDLAAWGLVKNARYLIYPSGTWDSTTLTVMANLGVLAARGVEPAYIRPPVLPLSHLHKLEATAIDASVSLDTAKGYVDQAIAEKTVLPLLFHGLAGGANWDQATFDEFIDYLVSKREQIHPITIADFYRLTLQGIRIPKVKA